MAMASLHSSRLPGTTSKRRGNAVVVALFAVAVVLALLVGANGAAGEELAFTARLDWRSEGEIYQVWFHREFDGLLRPIAPMELDGDAAAVALLGGVAVLCAAKTQIGLPDWSVAVGACSLSRSDGTLVIDIECGGTQRVCEGTWQVRDGTGAFAGVAGSGRTSAHLVEPMPMPWFWTGPVVGYTELRGTLIVP
jgi:hypothetical protein